MNNIIQTRRKGSVLAVSLRMFSKRKKVYKRIKFSGTFSVKSDKCKYEKASILKMYILFCVIRYERKSTGTFSNEETELPRLDKNMLAVVSNALSTTLHCAETMYQQFLCSFTAMTHVQLVSCLRVSCLDRSFSVLIYSNKQRW